MLRTVLEEKCSFIYDANMGAILISTDTMLSLKSVNHAYYIISSEVTRGKFLFLPPQ